MNVALNGTHCAQIRRAFPFTDMKWKTFGVLVYILHSVNGSTHKHFCAHSVWFVWSVLLQVNTQLKRNARSFGQNANHSSEWLFSEFSVLSSVSWLKNHSSIQSNIRVPIWSSNSSKVKYLKKGQVSRGKSSILDIGQVKNKKMLSAITHHQSNF